MDDLFSMRYASILDGTYDCVDRIVLNAYFQFGQRPAGFRTWWQQLEGTDDNLDNAHLMRMAGRLARRLRAHAKAHQIPVVDCATGERKDVIATEYLLQETLLTPLWGDKPVGGSGSSATWSRIVDRR